jgi:septal ring factor EnvC (AmiA/AmiB activator)
MAKLGYSRTFVEIVMVALAVGGACTAARAQTPLPDPKLERVRSDIVKAEGEISTLNQELKGLEGKRKGSQVRLSLLMKEEQRFTLAMNAITIALSQSQKRVGEAELRVFELQRRMKDRFRAFYMGGLAAKTPALFVPNNWSEISRMVVYTKALNSADLMRLDEIRLAIEELSRERAQLRERMNKHVELQKGLDQRKAEAQSELEKDQALVEQLQGKKRQIAALLTKLRVEAEKLESVVASLTSQSDEVPASPETPSPTDESRGYSKGLFLAGVKLVKPVAGSVVQGFGKVEVSEFSDIVFSKGVEFVAPDGAQVQAVLGGTVAFSGTMPGYDKVVIINHGERSYSLYGSLEKTLVAKGEQVSTGQEVGRAAVRGDKRRNFYFEVRRNGKPIDPRALFKGAL